ncbi:hypothetical protein LOD99_1241 [Oopsacas minuta]|uniref:Uncharacterized protein n=1 Tax=Oopsacas minuta TaxID=111878 RepID=A0AAV7K656_9METZ|nr:hypothetical protein LOD99_1241 [Oopsacas minuta]
MADWQRIQSRKMLQDHDRRDPLTGEKNHREHLLRLQQDIDHAITDSLISAPTDDDMDILRHLTRQNKRLREHGLTLREQVHRKEQIYRLRIADKRHETRAFEEMIDDLEKSNERLKDYYELYKGTGMHLDIDGIRKQRENEPANIPHYRKNVYDKYKQAYPSIRPEISKKTLAEMVQLKTSLRDKASRGELLLGGGDETKKMRDQMQRLKMEKEKMLKGISALTGRRGTDISLPKGATDISKDKLKEIAMMKLLAQKKGRKMDLDLSSSDSDSNVFESSSETDDDEDIAEKWKRMKEEKYKKLRKMSDAVESLHGDSPKEYRDRRKRRQNIEISKKQRNAGAAAGQVEEITQRLKELEERSAKVFAQKSKIDSLIEQHKQEAEDISDD